MHTLNLVLFHKLLFSASIIGRLKVQLVERRPHHVIIRHQQGLFATRTKGEEVVRGGEEMEGSLLDVKRKGGEVFEFICFSEPHDQIEPFSC